MCVGIDYRLYNTINTQKMRILLLIMILVRILIAKGLAPKIFKEKIMLAFQVDQTEILCYAKKPCSSNSSILFRFSSIRSFFLRIVSLKAALTSSRVLRLQR